MGNPLKIKWGIILSYFFCIFRAHLNVQRMSNNSILLVMLAMRHDPYMLIQDVEKKLIVGIVGSDTA